MTIETDPQADRRGGYGRLLVYLTYDGELFNRQFLDQGHARLYDSSFSKRLTFADAEGAVRKNDVGVWDYEPPSTPIPTPEPTPTPTQAPVPNGGSDSPSPSDLGVTTIHADAAGNDHENLNGEYITFTNTRSETLDLSGWTASDEADTPTTSRAGSRLTPATQ